MSKYPHAEFYEYLCQPGMPWDGLIAYYKKYSSYINCEISARERERIQNAAIPPHCPQDIADETEATARYLWQCRAEAKRQALPAVDVLPEQKHAPFPAAALAGDVMRIGVRYGV